MLESIKKYPVLYIDVDGVIRDHNHEYLEQGGAMPKTYYDEGFGKFYKEKQSDPKAFYKYLSEAPVFKGALESISLIRVLNLFNKINILSAQWNEVSQEATNDFLKRNGMYHLFDKIIYVKKGDHKPDVLKENPGILIDDRALTMQQIQDPSKGIWISTLTDDLPIIKESKNVLLTAPSLFGITVKLTELVKLL